MSKEMNNEVVKIKEESKKIAKQDMIKVVGIIGVGSIYMSNKSTNPSSLFDATGEGQAHNNLQPYITCYMWKRTA